MAPTSRHQGLSIGADASYLVTGGLGALGLQLARWLVAHGARRLVLAGRRPPGEPARAVIAECEALGARVVAAQGDVASGADVARMIAAADALGPLRGVVHAAGVLDDGLIATQTWARFSRVLAPKVAGASHLDAQTRDRPLDFFVLFSSMASVLGVAGQASYTAANAFLDALALQRASLGLPALSVNWGPWADAGMAADLDAGLRQRWEERGVRPIVAESGFAALRELMGLGAARAAVVDVDWQALASSGSVSTSRLIAELIDRSAPPREISRTAPAPEDPDAALIAAIKEAEPDARSNLVGEYCRRRVCAVLRLPAVAGTRALTDLGLDSLMAIELRNDIQRSFAVSVPIVTFLDGSTVDTLAEAIVSSLAVQAPDLPAEARSLPLTPAEAEALLERVNDLSEAEVDALLGALSAQEATPKDQ
jgi:NAD(P)-dependent dehydrogenase (short-subunit alcohol dehydrogenase family)